MDDDEYRQRIAAAALRVKQVHEESTHFETEFRMLKAPQWMTLPAWPSELYKKRKAAEEAAAPLAEAAAAAAAVGGAPVVAPAVALPDSPIGEERPYHVIRSVGELPEGAARPSTIVFAHNVVAKLKDIEAWIRACTAHALVSQLRAPPQGEKSAR